MKNRAPKFAIILILIISFSVFSYINFCPSVGIHPVNPNSLIVDAKQSFKMPEIEATLKVVKAVIGFIFPE